jgi:hypothetical protein
MGRAKTASGAPAYFLSGISGWFSLSLGAWVPKNLARRYVIDTSVVEDRYGFKYHRLISVPGTS